MHLSACAEVNSLLVVGIECARPPEPVALTRACPEAGAVPDKVQIEL